jgi:hypothetical protein
VLGDLGGKIEKGVRIETASQLPRTDVTMFDLAPGAIADILGDRLPGRVARAFRHFRYGLQPMWPGAESVNSALVTAPPEMVASSPEFAPYPCRFVGSRACR